MKIYKSREKRQKKMDGQMRKSMDGIAIGPTNKSATDKTQHETRGY